MLPAVTLNLLKKKKKKKGLTSKTMGFLLWECSKDSALNTSVQA